jgi:hypothetical protein
MPREDFRENEDFTIQGHWWRPGGPHRPAGDLKFGERKIELTLLGGLDDAIGECPFDRVPEVTDPDIIHGESVRGTPITLIGSFYTAWQPGGDWLTKAAVPITTSKLSCNGIVLGVHLPSETDAFFESCSVTIPNFARWLGDRPFAVEHSGGNEMPCFTVRYTRPANKAFEISDSIGIVRVNYAVVPPVPLDDATISHHVYLVIEPQESKPFTWYIEIARHLERFFTLLFGQPVQSLRTRLRVKRDCSGGADDHAQLYFRRRWADQRSLSPSEFLICYDDVKAYLAQMLKVWLTATSDIMPALDLLFSSIYEPAPFQETRFLPIVQAAEVFARASCPPPESDKAEFGRVRKVLQNAIPDDTPSPIREAFVDNLSYAGEPRLKHRLKSLTDCLEQETVELFCVNPDEFIRGIVDTRNFFTHYSSRYKRVLKGIELHWATLKVTTMLKILLLKRMGIPDSDLRTIFKKNYLLHRERQAWQGVSELGSPVDN